MRSTVRDDADMRSRNGREFDNLADVICAHFDHGKLIGIVTRTAILAELARTGFGLEPPKHVSAEY